MAQKNGIKIVSKEFEEFSTKLESRALLGLQKISLDTQAELMAASPVGKTGIFRSSWQGEVQISNTPKMLGELSIWNPTIYGEPLEVGSKKGKRPWPSAGPRTKEAHGRIWSSQAVGGVIEKTIDAKYVKDASETLTEYILGGF